jgi:hypothetical protein
MVVRAPREARGGSLGPPRAGRGGRANGEFKPAPTGQLRFIRARRDSELSARQRLSQSKRGRYTYCMLGTSQPGSPRPIFSALGATEEYGVVVNVQRRLSRGDDGCRSGAEGPDHRVDHERECGGSSGRARAARVERGARGARAAAGLAKAESPFLVRPDPSDR